MPRKKCEPERKVIITITGTTPDQFKAVELQFFKFMEALRSGLGRPIMGSIQVRDNDFECFLALSKKQSTQVDKLISLVREAIQKLQEK